MTAEDAFLPKPDWPQWVPQQELGVLFGQWLINYILKSHNVGAVKGARSNAMR
jgi:hypothetical protein